MGRLLPNVSDVDVLQGWESQVRYAENLADVNLTTRQHHLRLLRLNGRTESREDWELKVFALADAPPFAALSYSWGSQLPNMEIGLFNGEHWVRFKVTDDLWDALCQMSEANLLD